jgi:hypothetical protein
MTDDCFEIEAAFSAPSKQGLAVRRRIKPVLQHIKFDV